MKYPEPDLGSAQIKLLKTLKAAKGSFIPLDDERALEKLWKKGYVRWQAAAPGIKEWQITKTGLEALESKAP